MSLTITITEVEHSSDTPAFEVTLGEGDERTVHTVYVDEAYVASLGVDPESDAAIRDLLQRSFLFLLRREPKEAVLKQFDLHQIETYFPEYRRSITNSDT